MQSPENSPWFHHVSSGRWHSLCFYIALSRNTHIVMLQEIIFVTHSFSTASTRIHSLVTPDGHSPWLWKRIWFLDLGQHSQARISPSGPEVRCNTRRLMGCPRFILNYGVLPHQDMQGWGVGFKILPTLHTFCIESFQKSFWPSFKKEIL